MDEIIGAAVADGKVTPKVQSLIKILLKYQHTDDFRAIIFVERVVTALVLPKVWTCLSALIVIFLLHPLTYRDNSREMLCNFVGFCRTSVTKFCQVCKFDRA